MSSPAGHPAPDLRGVGVVVVNYGSSALLRANIADDLQASGARVHVVDNDSGEDERRAVRELARERDWSLLELDNVGFGAGMNAGVEVARAAGADTLLLLNPDASVTAPDLALLVASTRAEPLTMRSPLVVAPDGRVQFRGSQVLVREGRTRAADGSDPALADAWLAGTVVVLTVELWDAIGGFDDDYFLYWEDVDLSWRCSSAGGGLVVDTRVRAVHDGGATQTTAHPQAKSTTYYYWNCRNRLLFAARHLAPRDRLRWALGTPRYAVEVLLRGGRRQLLHPVAPVGAVVRGSLAGLRLLVTRRRSQPAAPHAPGAVPASPDTRRTTPWHPGP
ncbi:glycosyltransferase family 2 protein [Cellulomonas sp. 179-A 4D5 NHS]|uniref:glycosyltransferase family 2 protein n=1 Tax=Cellulomonas sp. 179-A 4D5 NHS TaxID=3142378 RepID=UPI0039A07126